MTIALKSRSAAFRRRAEERKGKILSSPPDLLEREQALNLDLSFIVEAPAGSGKTSLLAQRYLALLSRVKRPESIVAMTFTRKAAAELTERIHAALRDAVAGTEISNDYARRTREFADAALQNGRVEKWNLEGDLSRLQIQTIDSLCAMLTRQMPIVSEFGGIGQVVEDARELYRLAARRTLRNLTEGTSEQQALFRRVSLHFDNDMSSVEGQITRMLQSRDQWRRLIDSAESPLAQDFCQLLGLASDALLDVFRERSTVDFTEVTRAAIRALGEPEQPSDLLYWLDYRIEHLLVDEFQDTSRAQYELVEALTGQWSDGDGRTLFVVGDPMQSIYRFREAEVSLFLECQQARRLGSVRLTPLQLTANFRSTAAIVDWAQSTFAGIMPNDDLEHGAVKLRAAVATRTEAGSAPVVIPFIEDDGAAEANEVVRIVKAARSRGTVAILLRSRSHVARILPGLRREGIPYEAVEIDELREEQHILDLISLTRAITHLGDRISWLACLRAPWCGLTLADLSALAEGETQRTVLDLLSSPQKMLSLSPDGHARAQRTGEVLSTAVAQVGRCSLRTLVESAWLSLGGPAILTEASQSEDATTFFELLESREEGGLIRDFSLLDEALATLYAKPSTAPDCVQVLTIHKAKGLEFDTVILPQMARAARGNERELLLWTETRNAHGEMELRIAAQPQKAADDQEYNFVSAEIKVKDRHEANRLFYVAVTRAKNELYLLGNANTKANRSECKKAPTNTFLGLIWDSVKAQFENERRRQQAPQQSSLDFKLAPSTVLRRLPADWRLPQFERSIEWQPQLQRAAASARAVTYEWVGDTARHVGVVAHDLLKRAAAGESLSRIKTLAPLVRAELLQLGVPRGDITRAANQVFRAIDNTFRSERGQWILTAHAEARSEWPIGGRVGDKLINGTVDRCFRDSDGRFWIVDFKTGAHQGGDADAFLDEEQRRHRSQLETYATLISRMVRGPIWLGLYFPLMEGWREWQLAGEKEAVVTAH